jgi:outer membrane protein
MRNWRIKIGFIALFSLLSSNAAQLFAAEPQSASYPLPELYRQALIQAEQIEIAKENLAIAENLRVQALSVLKPRLSAVGSYTRYDEEKIFFNTVIQPQWQGGYGLRLGQSFTLNGREISALRVAERGIDKSRADLADIKERYLFGVAQAFYDVAKSRESLAIAQANVQRLEIHLNAVQSRLKLKDVPITELYRSEAELSDAQAYLIQAENNLQLNKALLGRLIGSRDPVDIKADPQWVAVPDITDLETLKQTALANRSDLKSLSFQEKIAEHQVTYTKGSYWPRVGVQAVWMRMLQDPDPLLDESTYIGLNLEMDIYDGGLRRAQISDARRQQHQAELARHDTERRILVEIEQSWLYWKTQQEVTRSYESQLRYAKENYEAVHRLFDHGLANSVDVMDANTLLVTAQRQVSEAHNNSQLAGLAVERAAGTFLSRIEANLSQNRILTQQSKDQNKN